MIVHKTRGLIAAPFTPMNHDKSLCLDTVPRYSEWLCKNKVVGAFICGTTGEGTSLTLQERRQVAEAWVASATRDLQVIVHVGHTAMADCRDLAAHAQSIGADSIACMAPFFFKPHGVKGLVDWCQEIASAAPELPFYYYHIPSMNGFSVDVSQFLQLAEKSIPNLAGVKFTFEDLEDYQRCVELFDGKFDILFGRDERLLSAMKLGAIGAVGSTYNFAAPIYHALIKAFEGGNLSLAQQSQDASIALINTLVQGGVHPVATFKWYMSRVAVDCGPARLPLVGPSEEQIVALDLALQSLHVST